MSSDGFVGTWRLVSCIWTDTAGAVTYPYGRSPVGYLIYTADGYMAVNFMSANRRRFASDRFPEAAAEEERGARKTYQAYSGRYEVRDGRMIHHVEVSLFPNWVGRDQERFYELDGDRLRLSTEPLPFGSSYQVAHLEWQRVTATPPGDGEGK
jgi:hypothetical protein